MSRWKDIDEQLDDAVLDAATMFTDMAMRIQTREDVEGKPYAAADLCIRYEAGNAEHKDSWEDWDKDRFLKEAYEELLDLILYHAMMRVVHKD